MRQITVAVAQYDFGFFDQWSEFFDKITAWVAQAAGESDRLLVFPEYGTMELASLLGKAIYCKSISRTYLDCI